MTRRICDSCGLDITTYVQRDESVRVFWGTAATVPESTPFEFKVAVSIVFKHNPNHFADLCNFCRAAALMQFAAELHEYHDSLTPNVKKCNEQKTESHQSP